MNYTSNSTALSNDELTEIIKNDRYARTLANIARRAETLWEDGYKAEKFATDFYHVFSPKGDIYSVLLNEGSLDACDCPAWKKFGTCKHKLAVEKLAREEAEADAFDALMANAETADGCDAYSEW